MNNLNGLKQELSIKAKNGADFIIAASIIWFAISLIWTLSASSYDKSVLTFIVGGMMLPLAFGLSKLLKTNWKVPNNPLQPLGLWLNFAQLFYFPFLIFVLIKQPDYFVMTYAIITGAHFFPYGWYYSEKGYSIFAGLISFGTLFFGLFLSTEKMYIIPLFTAISLAILAIIVLLSYRNKASLAQNNL
jgi:hypothetical protein